MKAQISKIEKEGSAGKDKRNFNQDQGNGRPGYGYSHNKQHHDGWKLYWLYRNVMIGHTIFVAIIQEEVIAINGLPISQVTVTRKFDLEIIVPPMDMTRNIIKTIPVLAIEMGISKS